MKNESELATLVRQKFLNFGYESASIVYDFETPKGNKIDIVVFDQKKPFIVIEVKDVASFPQSSDSMDLRFDPDIRSVQRLANEINAPYYALANIDKILWFETDQIGRPRLLLIPVIPTSGKEQELAFDVGKETITRSLFRLLDYAPEITDPDNLVLYASVAIYAHILEKTGDASLKNAILDPFAHPQVVQAFETEIQEAGLINRGNVFFSRSSSLLGNIPFLKVAVDSLLAAFDEFLLLRTKSFAYKLPRWLTDLFIQLADPGVGDLVVDIFSNFGDVAAAIMSSGKNARVISIVSHPINYLWAKIQQRVRIGNGESQILFGSIPPDKIVESYQKNKPSMVIVAPPFNVKLESRHHGLNLSEDIYLSLALDWVKPGGRVVAIMPEGFMYSQNLHRKAFRQHILNSTTIKAILSLDALIPNTSIKSSILVLDQSPNDENDQVLMAHILRSDLPTDVQGAMRCSQIPRVAQILDAFKSYDKTVIKATGAWTVATSKLTAENLSIDRYATSRHTQLFSTYSTVQLSEIASVFKGSPLTIDKYGDLPVIGPSSVRKLHLNAAKVDRTNRWKLPKNPVVAQRNDIVINALNKYKGQAALVEADFVGYNISRNIIVVRLLSTQLLPAYLAIALNSEFVARQLQERTTGAVVPQVTKSALSKILIPLPDIEVQKQVIEEVTVVQKEVLSAQYALMENHNKLLEAEKQLNSLLEHLHSGGGIQ